MYRTSQYRIGKNNRLHRYCGILCSASAALYNRANFIVRQYASAVVAMKEYRPLYVNQMEILQLVNDTLAGTGHLGQGAWLSYHALDYLLKTVKDETYYALPAQANQQTLKLLLRDYRSFFESVRAYGRNPSAFTGRPRMPKYVSTGKGKTVILTNQICRIREDRVLKFPGTKEVLRLGGHLPEGKLKEVRIKPCGADYTIDVVMEVLGTGITPQTNEELLGELGNRTDISDLRIMAMDPGVDNLVAVVNNFGENPFVIKGGEIKSINRYYNKEIARLSACAMTCNGRNRTRRMEAVTEKRRRRIKDRFHKISRQLADYARNHHVDVIVMGHNVFQKQRAGMGHTNNQNFVQIPMKIFADMLRYKLAEYGIRFVEVEESYTSKADFLAMDAIPEYGKEEGMAQRFSGTRIKRGLYLHGDGTVTNADINGAANILRKVFPKVTQWDRGIVDMPCSSGCATDPEGSCRTAA